MRWLTFRSSLKMVSGRIVEMAYLQIIPEDGVWEDVEMAYLQIIPEDGVREDC